MQAKDFLRDTINDLEQKIATGGNYNLIKSAGLLRLLVADGGNSLALRANVDKLKLSFKIADSGELQSSKGLLHIVALEPNDHFGSSEVRLHGLLAREIMSWNEYRYSVHDFIKIVAHIQGGVHYSGFSTPEEINLEHLIKSGLGISFDNNGPTDPNLALLVPIYRVIRKGLVPLMEP